MRWASREVAPALGMALRRRHGLARSVSRHQQRRCSSPAGRSRIRRGTRV